VSAEAPEGSVVGYRLSAQQAYLWRAAENGATSWAQARLRIDGEVGDAALRRAADGLVARHEVLRTTFVRVPPVRTPVQVIRDDGRVDWTEIDLRALVEADQERRLTRIAHEQRTGRFDLADGPLVRVALIHLGATSRALLVTTPAIAADTATMRMFAAELGQAYADSLPEVDAVRYSQFAQWQGMLRTDGEPVAPPRTAFAPLPLQRAAVGDTPDTQAVRLTLPAYAASAVADYATAHGVSTKAVLLACWQIMLWKLSGTGTVTVGVRFDGRVVEDLQGCAGPFATWAAVSAEVTATSTLAEVASSGQHDLTAIGDSDDLLRGARPDDVAPWGAAFEYDEAVEPLSTPGVRFTVESVEVADEPCVLKLSVTAGPGGTTTALHYSAARFDPRHARELAGQYHSLVTDLTREPAKPAGRASLLGPGDHARLLDSFTDRWRAGVRCVHRLVEDQAARTPEAIAVSAPDGRLSYADLMARADRLARVLLSGGVRAETRVAVHLEPCAQLIVALLGVLRAGGTYVPVDPALPRRRARELVRLAGCHLVLTAGEDWEDTPVRTVNVNDEPAVAPRLPAPRVEPDNLAYVIFTSGTTGRPKGVAVPHRAVANYLLWSAQSYAAQQGDGALVHSSTGFDLTVTSLFAPLVTGRTVHLNPAWRTIDGLANGLADRQGLDVLKVTPSHLTMLERLMPPASLAGTAHSLVVGGEQLTWDAVRPWLRHAPGTSVINEYGPTETAVGCCAHRIAGDADDAGVVPIGRPVAGAELYVLDERLAPVPAGVPGELYIGGPGLARGYLANPSGTAERFVASPFSPGARLYRTGDLVCHSPDGLLYVLGRTDDQVKVRGVRVELGAVRAALTAHPAVTDAETLLAKRSENDAALCAYLVGDAVPDGELRAFLADWLHPATIPDTYTWLPRLPLTVNGKVDRAALPRPWEQAGLAARAVAPPRSATERLVIGVFEDVLGRSPIGVDEDFFDLGGHSLLAVRLIARLNETFGCRLPVAVLFSEEDSTEAGPSSPERLAQLVTGPDTPQASCLVRLREHGTRSPLFCLPPAGGDVLGYRELAVSRSLDRPLYALQTTAVLPNDVEPTVEGLADRYAAEVRTALPTAEPRLLVGWSMGGLVALEIARRLEASGVPAEAVILVECYPPDLVPAYDADDVAREIAERFGPTVDRNDKAVRDTVMLTRAHLRALQTYRPVSYAGRVVLFQAEQQDAALRSAAENTWRALCPGLTEVSVLPGDHYSLFRPPHVEKLAVAIERVTAGRA
jgi:amino acid adenylation domain-containing protein